MLHFSKVPQGQQGTEECMNANFILAAFEKLKYISLKYMTLQ